MVRLARRQNQAILSEPPTFKTPQEDPMLIYIFAGIAVVIAVLVVIIATRPNEFCVSRSTIIPAPAALIFEQVNNFHNWEEWSPWAKLDPSARNSFDGPSAGVGSIFRWEGNNKVGQGEMTILESRPNQIIQIRLEFLKPFRATNTAEFRFEPSGSQTAVT